MHDGKTPTQTDRTALENEPFTDSYLTVLLSRLREDNRALQSLYSALDFYGQGLAGPAGARPSFC